LKISLIMQIKFDRAQKWKLIKNKMLAEMNKPNSQYIKSINDVVVKKTISRTKSGVDIGGMRFKPYCDEYALRKGYSAADLTLSGRMLSSGSFKYQTIFQGGRVMIRIWMEGGHGKISTGLLASVHNFGMLSGRSIGPKKIKGFKMPKREFFGIDKKITDAIKKLSTDKWREIMRSLS